ncbi:MEMO1 family [Coniella lustricola]|uniref:MEMO1 family n=1 Tax=Coniella lustricola TaxID=2025994 RepID=A0A2T3AAP7_9PEZI|nr:MEMO1 family [Coniella lustricola]
MASSGTREATHAGSWYQSSAKTLSRQLDGWLDNVPASVDGKALPIPKARVIIAPHAGYSYSGPCAAWAYKSLDLSSAKRIFVLGPSHTYYLKGSALTTFTSYETPFGNLQVDVETVKALRDTGKFSDIPRNSDEDEHSLEMHLPYIWKRIEQTHGQASQAWPTIVPILVGDNKGPKEKEFGELLAPYLQDSENAFVVSSDFCHWGTRFSYTKYVPAADRLGELRSLSRRDTALETPIHEGIKVLDQLAMDAVASGHHDEFVSNLSQTNNTVCGRHPIGVIMAALEVAAGGTVTEGNGKFAFLRYERSSLVESVADSSVSYASAYAVI